jgi:hypothetical protein
LPGFKHLLRKFVNYGQKSFITMGPEIKANYQHSCRVPSVCLWPRVTLT